MGNAGNILHRLNHSAAVIVVFVLAIVFVPLGLLAWVSQQPKQHSVSAEAMTNLNISDAIESCSYSHQPASDRAGGPAPRFTGYRFGPVDCRTAAMIIREEPALAPLFDGSGPFRVSVVPLGDGGYALSTQLDAGGRQTTFRWTTTANGNSTKTCDRDPKVCPTGIW